jgi:CubicO group peptidase (beta-lactamase class C family)
LELSRYFPFFQADHFLNGQIMKKLLPFFAILLILSCSESNRIELKGDLQIGQSTEGTLEKKTPVSYNLELDSNTFLYGAVEQVSVDVVVSLYDSEDQLVESFDGPASGPEYFSYTIDETGSYRLEIAPFEETSGDYSIRIDKVEPVAKEPNRRVDQLFAFYTGDAPGAVAGVIRNGKLAFSRAYGKANLTHDIDFGLDMPTNIGSVSKQFTAFAILLLEKEGKLSLEDDVRKHIPEFPEFEETITVKHLLNHTNGLREVYNLMPITGWRGEDFLQREEILRILNKQKALQNAPGEAYNYNNSAFILAAEMVERISGEDFPEWMKANVFDPLGMENTYVRKSPAHIIPKATQGYTQNEDGIVEAGDLYAAYGAGGIYTTASDLAKWLNNFKDAEVGGMDVINKLVTPGIKNDGDTLTYGLGIGVGEYRGRTRYAHSGADIAHRATLMYFPELEAGVVTLSNNASFPASRLATQLVDLFFDDQLEPEEENEKGASSDDNVEIELTKEELEQFKGKFKAESIGLVIEYKVEDDQLVAYPQGQSALKLQPITSSSFSYSQIEASVEFVIDEGEVTGAIHTQGGTDYELTKLPPFNPSIEEMSAYEGKFFSEEVETFYKIEVKDSILVASHRNMDDIKLSPTEDDTFGGNVFFMSEVAFQRDAKGVITGFNVSNGRTKGILFEKQ